MFRLVLVAALLGCAQSFKILAKHPAPSEYLYSPSYAASSYYVAPLYLSRAAPSYEYQLPAYKQLEITKYSSPLQTLRNPLTGGLHLGRQPYQPIAVPVPVAVPVGQGSYGSYNPYRPYDPYSPYTPYASEPILKATYSSEPAPEAPLHYGSTKGAPTQQEIKAAPEPPRQLENKGQEPQRELGESAKGYKARPLQEELPQQQQEEQWEQKPRDQIKSNSQGEVLRASQSSELGAPLPAHHL